ncbi:MAG: threonylcarbamoyl-AMP synthase [Gammaproteobacteria bacterium]|jgi:tRNA threonylcarbamoyl adenosine modification protein (Sua5/YciO/YrdC/YwlC family)|nr:threonylcarbamoyl-AMP synthase [Gammaproteobacteria bacterium]
MSQRLHVHPLNPQLRLIRQAAELIRKGSLVVYPTDSGYAFGWHIGDRAAAERLQRIRQTGKDHNFTLVCRDLSEIATYARIENPTYRLLRAHTPGPYTFILRATREVPRRLQNPKQQTVGIRVPDHPVPLALLAELGEPLMSSTLILPDHDLPLADPDDIEEALAGRIDLLIDSRNCGLDPTTVVDLTGSYPRVLRQGRGDASAFA